MDVIERQKRFLVELVLEGLLLVKLVTSVTAVRLPGIPRQQK
jgi:hypothetical protein